MFARDVEMFIEHCENKGLATKTIGSYEQTLRLLMLWLDEQGIVQTEKITHVVIQDYVKQIKERGKYTVTSNPNSGNYQERRIDFGKKVSDVTINNYLTPIMLFAYPTGRTRLSIMGMTAFWSQYSQNEDRAIPAHGGNDMNNEAMMNRAKQLVVDYFNAHADVTDGKKLTMEDVFIVWFSKTLQNWKALVSTTVSDGMYYEITHNGDKNETYLDAYKKWDNKCIPD